jgi:hypothetical protein
MGRVDVERVRVAVWKWLCRCPEAIGPVGAISDDDEFFTPPTSPLPSAAVHDGAHISPSSVVASGVAQPCLSPAQTHRLRRQHAEVVRQLTTPPPIVAPRPQSPLKAFQRPTMVYRPSWVD